jgi:predicted amidohydrolase
MSRSITVAAAQLGPIQKAEARSVAVDRMVRLMERAHRRGVELVVFPELALTTFFPRHCHADIAEADHWFETTMPSNATARRRRFNTSILVNPDGDVMLKYRKVHLPGHAEFDPRRKVQHLEKRYFEVGNLGFPVIRAPMGAVPGINMGMLICNDRRWPEARICRYRRGATRMPVLPWRQRSQVPRMGANCSATRSSSIRRARSWRWRRAGTMN